MLGRMLFDHPRSVGESYGEHLLVASGFGLTMIGAGLACMVHAMVPGMFARTGSAAIEKLHSRMVRNHHRVSAAPRAALTPAGDDAA